MATDSVTLSPLYNGDSVSLTAGMIVRLKPGANNNVVRAQADTAPHVQGVNGVVVSGASAPTSGVLVAAIGRETVQMESGLTPAVGNTVYVSPNVAGRGTNVAPSVLLPIGAIADISDYVRLGTVEVDVVCGSSGVGGGGAFPGYGAPGSIGPNEPTTGTSQLVLRADSLPGQKIEAQWPIANVRWYALDANAPDDSAAGFSDVSEAAAGLVAKKTIAGLAAIFPPIGNGRKVSISINQGTYSGALDPMIFGVSGYGGYTLKGTGTQANAGATAFAGNANTDTFNGGILVPGLNATGYNPTGGATTTVIPLQLAGGGAAALPAEPAAPLGWRIRFDIATATVALRGICKAITQVSASQVSVNTALSTLPGLTDVFYIEKAGVIVGASSIQIGAAFQGNAPVIAGIDFNGQIVIYASVPATTLAFCGCASIQLTQNYTINTNRFYSDIASGTTRSSGGGLRNNGTMNQNGWGGNHQFVGFVQAGASPQGITLESTVGSAQTGCFSSVGMTVWGGGLVADGITNQTGGASSTAPLRIAGPNSSDAKPAGITFRGTRTSVDGIVFSNMGAHPCMALVGQNDLVFSSTLGVGVSGSTGNTDVGLDLTQSQGSTIVLRILPTTTGTAGDVRLSDGTIISWATAAAGVIDTYGNQIYALGSAPLGTKVASAATAVALGNVAPGTVTSATPTVWTPLVINGVKYLVPLWPST